MGGQWFLSLFTFFSEIEIALSFGCLEIMCLSVRLADYDVVVTTYSLVSKEIPVQKEEAHNPSKDLDHVVKTEIRIILLHLRSNRSVRLKR